MMDINRLSKALIDRGYDNIQVMEFDDRFRLNGVVDILKLEDSIYEIPLKKYTETEDIEESIVLAASSTFKYKIDANGKINLRTEYEEWEKVKGVKGNDHLYFIITNEMHVKIGRSVDPPERVKIISTGCPVGIYGYFWVKNKGCLEKNFHKWFAELRLHGEWFRGNDRLWAFIYFLMNNYSDVIDMVDKFGHPDYMTEKEIIRQEELFMLVDVPFGKLLGKNLFECFPANKIYFRWLHEQLSNDCNRVHTDFFNTLDYLIKTS